VLKLHHIFFLNFLGIFIGTLLLSSLVAYLSIKNTAVNEHTLYLKNQLSLLEMQLPHTQDLDTFAADIHKKVHLRVTIINENGLVIAESNEDKSVMDNHAGRAEVMEAATQEYGTIMRYSDTIGIDFIYVAKQISYRDKPVILRLSVSLDKVMKDFYDLWYRLAIVFTAFVIIGLLIALKISKKIRHDLLQITEYLREVSDKNYKAIVKPEYFSEFLYIALTLKNLAKKAQQPGQTKTQIHRASEAYQQTEK
jgi:two-component system, OmpR family, phosphate regulon sensor histidine kinase PhoR